MSYYEIQCPDRLALGSQEIRWPPEAGVCKRIEREGVRKGVCRDAPGARYRIWN